MNYNKLRERYFKNNPMSKEKQLIVKGYIDHCESHNIPIEVVISALYHEDQVGCYHDCNKCATPIC